MTSPRRPTRRRALVAVVLPTVLLAAGCGASGSDADAPLVPGDAPDGWAARAMGPVTVSAPADWAELDVDPGADADEAYGLKAPGGDPGTGVHTSVTSSRARDAADAVANLESVGLSTLGAEGASSAELAWPGAQSAGYLTYAADLEVGGEQVEVRYEYLVLDVGDEAQVVVAVVGPAATFDALGVHDVLASVTVG